jgi:hypothetical protein
MDFHQSYIIIVNVKITNEEEVGIMKTLKSIRWLAETNPLIVISLFFYCTLLAPFKRWKNMEKGGTND